MPNDFPENGLSLLPLVAAGVWQQMNQALRKVRQQAGRQLSSAAIVDSQSVKTTELAREVGYDGAKLVKVQAACAGRYSRAAAPVVVSAANVSEKLAHC